MARRKRKKSFNTKRAATGIGLILVLGMLTCCQQAQKTTTEQPHAVIQRQAGAPEIRVAVLNDAPNVEIIAGLSGARVLSNGQMLKQVGRSGAVRVAASGAGLLVDGQPASGNIRIESLSDACLRVGGGESQHEVASKLLISRAAGRGGLLVVAQLDLEEYLAGVLAGEVPYERWHPEALKAQAITSRSYAYYEMRTHAKDAFDVESTVMSQVFKPGFRNVPALANAVSSTQGLVLTSNNTVFPAYFHSTCGGHTEPAGSVFADYGGARALSGAACPYCSQSPSYRWKMLLNKEALANKLRSQPGGQTLGRIEALEFVDSRGASSASASGDLRRAVLVRVRGSGGAMQMQGNAFRLAAGAKELKSLLIESVTDRGEAFEISGGGFGHGVGLCQYGSQGMAQASQPYPNILGLYFPGAALTKVY